MKHIGIDTTEQILVPFAHRYKTTETRVLYNMVDMQNG